MKKSRRAISRDRPRQGVLPAVPRLTMAARPIALVSDVRGRVDVHATRALEHFRAGRYAEARRVALAPET
jgi:hypothetical protein